MAVSTFQVETWTELGVGCLFVFARTCARWKIVGLRNFRLDDYLIILLIILWAIAIGLANKQAKLGALLSLTVEEIQALEPLERKNVELGGKIVLVSWFLYVSVIWLAKACLLCYYSSFRSHIWHQKRLIKITAWVVGGTYIAVMCTILGQCTPIQNNWKADHVPSLRTFFSLQFRLLFLFTLSQTQISLGRKVVLACFVCTGIFTIAAAIVTFSLVLLKRNSPKVGNLWVNRERLIWVVLLCAPSIASTFRREFWSTANKTDPYTLSQHLDMERVDATILVRGSKGDDENEENHLA